MSSKCFPVLPKKNFFCPSLLISRSFFVTFSVNLCACCHLMVSNTSRGSVQIFTKSSSFFARFFKAPFTEHDVFSITAFVLETLFQYWLLVSFDSFTHLLYILFISYSIFFTILQLVLSLLFRSFMPHVRMTMKYPCVLVFLLFFQSYACKNEWVSDKNKLLI